VSDLTAAEFEALGVYHPSAPHAAQQLELLEFLVSLGATPEDLVAHRGELPGLASIVTIRGGGALTVRQAAERAGVDEDKLLQINRAAGFPEPGPDDRAISEQFAGLIAGMAAAEAVFGEDAVLQLLRVMGSGMARLADAIVSAFLVNVEVTVRDRDPVGLSVARANADASALLPTVNSALDILLRQHIIAARRTIPGDAAASGYETQRMCVGFIDLVGSTALAQQLTTRELGGLLTTFEHIASDTVTSAGGRIVKLIGDEVLYTTSDESSACTIALHLVATFRAHPLVPEIRAGLAAGDVLVRDGDVFGPVVNLAARAAKLAPPGEVVVPITLATAAGITSEQIGQHQLEGFDREVELCRLKAP
jgi:adenylate cyclase